MTNHVLAFLILLGLSIALIFAILITEVVAGTDVNFAIYAILKGVLTLLLAISLIPVYWYFVIIPSPPLPNIQRDVEAL